MWGKKGVKLLFAIALVVLQALGVAAKKAPSKKNTNKAKSKLYSCDELENVDNLIVKLKDNRNSSIAFASASRKYKVKNFRYRKVFREEAFVNDAELQNYFQVKTDETNHCEEAQALLSELNARTDIEYAEPDFKANISAEISSQITDTFFNSTGSWGQEYDDQWALKKIEADKAWAITEGDKAIVAVIDTGVDYNHPDLWDNIWVNPEFASDSNADGKINLDDLDLNHNKKIEDNEIIPGAIGVDLANNDYNPLDDQGHGTHVSGIIAASKNDKGIVGVAPKAKILIIKAMDSKGVASFSNLMKAVAYAAKYADLANNSWTATEESSALRKAFLKASKQGLISIAAAGNSGKEIQGYPAAYTESVIGVASSSVDDERSQFSNYGGYIAIAAPGGGETGNDQYLYKERNILSTVSYKNAFSSYREYIMQESDSSFYLRLAGTSMSTAYVSGVVAMLKSLNKGMKFAEAKAYISNYGDTIGTSQYGFSKRLNAFKTVYNAKARAIKTY